MASKAAVLAVAVLLLVGATLQGCTESQKKKERQAQANPAPYEEEDHGKHHEKDAGKRHERERAAMLASGATSKTQGCGCGNPHCNCLPDAAPATLLARGRGPRAPNCNCTAGHCAAGCHCRVCVCRTPEPAPAELASGEQGRARGCTCGNPDCNCWTPATLVEGVEGPRAANCNCTASRCAAGCHCRACVCRTPGPAPAAELASSKPGQARGCNCGNPGCNCWTPTTLIEHVEGPRAANCNCTASHCAAGCHCHVCICRTPEPVPAPAAELAGEGGGARGCNCGNPNCNCWTPTAMAGERAGGHAMPAAAMWLSETARQGARPVFSLCMGFLLGALCTILIVRVCAPAPQGPAREPLIRTT